jgi:hypothetical protein
MGKKEGRSTEGSKVTQPGKYTQNMIFLILSALKQMCLSNYAAGHLPTSSTHSTSDLTPYQNIMSFQM